MNPHQKHSETSKEAAMLNTTAQSNRAAFKAIIRANFDMGAIADEISALTKCAPNEVSPRLSELEQAGEIVRLKETRMTRSSRRAHVYVLPEHVRGRVVLQPKQSDVETMKKLKADNERMQAALKFIAGCKSFYVEGNSSFIIEYAGKALCSK